MYQVLIANYAKRKIKKFAKELRQKIYKEASMLSNNPLDGDKLKGKLSFLYSLHFRYKKTDYRIAYIINHKNKTIIVQFVDIRENFYQKLKRLL